MYFLQKSKFQNQLYLLLYVMEGTKFTPTRIIEYSKET